MAHTLAESQTRELKPEQKAAAHTLDRHVSVTAGPGAGKTTVLVERYLEILRTKRASVDNIVAITFTNRAANEMRVRLREEIDEILRSTNGAERIRWVEHKRALEGAAIMTIHGFCSRLLRDFPVEAQIDPEFVLLDEHQAAILLETVVEQTLTEALHRNTKVVELAQAIGRAKLAAGLAELYRAIRDQDLRLDEIARQTEANHATEADYFTALREAESAMEVFLSARSLPRIAEEKRVEAVRRWPALRASLFAVPKSLAEYCALLEEFSAAARPGRNSAIAKLADNLQELLWGEKKEKPFGRVPQLCFDLFAKDYAAVLLGLVGQIEARLEKEKAQLSALTFDDLQSRALRLLEDRSAALVRAGQRFKFFLVDEFQDTNSLQRDLMAKLALAGGANLFIVGDRKQSIYGFRGADVGVFQEMTKAIETRGGLHRPLALNFRSQKPLVDAYNFIFERIFQTRSEITSSELEELGYVNHEPSTAERNAEHSPPLVELLVDVMPDNKPTGVTAPGDEEEGERPDARERDAAHLVERINALLGSADILSAKSKSRQDACAPRIPGFQYRDIALLFRALTGVWAYEAALRRAGVPYFTVQGKGFYQREEITDLIQLLRFLDNTTDELALAAVLRSPLCGLSDNTLLALRCAPRIGNVDETGRLRRRNLLRALRCHREIQFIEEADHVELDRVSAWLDSMIQRRNRCGIAELLRFAVAQSEFITVIAANFDGAQRVANVEKLFRLAEQFEKSGAHLIRDFVHFVEEFEAIGGRESEGQIDESVNAVRLMTIHQAKGLEFPVVIVPDLHREPTSRDGWYALDRNKGLTVCVPDGRGQTVRGALFNEFRRRTRLRDEFESMRLLYVAATRAKDRLIFSGALPQKDLKNLTAKPRGRWLAWIWQALELGENARSGLLNFGNDVQIQLTVAREPQASLTTGLAGRGRADSAETVDLSRPFEELFPLLRPISAEPGRALHRFSVTQLINFQRCPRQYYFDRLLRTPGADELAIWNNAEAPEPPANLTATLKGAVIHRFCEMFSAGENVEEHLRRSFDDVIHRRQADLADRILEIDRDQAIAELMPLANSYLNSKVFQRIEAARRLSDTSQFHFQSQGSNSSNPPSEIGNPQSTPGLWSELAFRLRRPAGILSGVIDKLLVAGSLGDSGGLEIEIIDFKTNRFRKSPLARQVVAASAGDGSSRQGSFDFTTEAPNRSPAAEIETTARDYQLQMQAYALAVRELFPNGNQLKLRATLHFLDPGIEFDVDAESLEHETCTRAVDETMLTIVSRSQSIQPGLITLAAREDSFPPIAAPHCRTCNFLELCPAGRDWLRFQNRER